MQLAIQNLFIILPDFLFTMVNLVLVAVALWQLATFQTSIIDLVGMDLIEEFVRNLCAGLVIAFLISYVALLIFFFVGTSVEMIYLFLIQLFNLTVTILSPLFLLLHQILSRSLNIVQSILMKVHGMKSAVSSPAPLTVKKNDLKDNGPNDTKLPHVLKFSPIFTVEIAPEAKALIPAAEPKLVNTTTAQAISISISLILLSIQSAIIVNASLAIQSTRAASVQLFKIVTVFAKSCLRILTLISAYIIGYTKTIAVHITTSSQALYHYIDAMLTVTPPLLDQEDIEPKMIEQVPAVEIDPIPAPVENDNIMTQEATVVKDTDDKYLPAITVTNQFAEDSPFRRIYGNPQLRSIGNSAPRYGIGIPTLRSRHNPKDQLIREQRGQIKELQRKNADQLWDQENWDLHRSVTSLRSELQSTKDGLKHAEARNLELTQYVQDLAKPQDKPTHSTDVSEKISTLEHQHEDQIKEIAALKEDNAKAKAEVTALKQQNQDVLFNMSSNTEYAALKSDNAALKVRVGELNQQYEDLHNCYINAIMGDDDDTIPATTTSTPSTAITPTIASTDDTTTPTITVTPATISTPTVAESSTNIITTEDVHDETISQLKHQVQMLEASLKSAPSTDMIAGLREANQVLQCEVNTYKSSGKLEIERLQAIIKDHERDAVQHSLNMITLRTEHASDKEILQTLNDTNQTFTVAGQQLEVANEELKAKLAQTDAELVNVKRDLAEKIQDEIDNKAENDDNRNGYLEAHDNFLKKQTEVTKLESAIHEKDSQILLLTTKVQEASNEIEGHKNESTEQMVELQNQLIRLRDHHDAELTKLRNEFEIVVRQKLKENGDAWCQQMKTVLVQQRMTDSEAAQAVQASMRQKFEDQLDDYKKEVKFLDERYDIQSEKFDRLEDKISELEHENVELKLTNGGVEYVKQEYELKQVELSRQYDELKKKSDEAAAAAKRKFDKVVEQRDHEWRNCLKRQEQIDHLHGQLQANVRVDPGVNERIAHLEQRLQYEEVQHRITADKAAKDRELRGVAERKVASLEKQLNTA